MISDIHEDPNIIVPAIETLKNQGVEKLIVNGDIGGNYGSLEKSQQYTAFILDKIGRSGLEAFVQPGSHETLLGFGPVLDHFVDKYPNIVDATKNRKVEQGDHDLVFLPGSDFLCGGEYSISMGKSKIPTGEYFVDEHGKLLPLSTPREELQRLSDLGKLTGRVHHSNMNDLIEQVTNPDKTVVVCHVPRKFDNVETGVDMAEFGLSTKTFDIWHVEYDDGRRAQMVTYDLDGDKIQRLFGEAHVKKILDRNHVDEGSVFPLKSAMGVIRSGAPVEIRKENRGNEDLRDLYAKLGVRKAVSAHFHESSHRAHDSNAVIVPENTFVEELFWNSGHGDRKQFGILNVDGERVSYENVNLI